MCMYVNSYVWVLIGTFGCPVLPLSDLSLEGGFPSDPGAVLTAANPTDPPVYDPHSIISAQVFIWVLEILNGDPQACVSSVVSL